MDLNNIQVYKITLGDSTEIAKVPLGGLENCLSCILKSVSSVNISLIDYEFT